MPEDETTTTTEPETATTDAAASETDDASVDWKAKAREWEKRAKDNHAKLKAAEPKLSEYDRLVEASKSELERAQEAATTAAAQITAYQDRTVKAEIRAAATDRFVDADVPFAYLDTKKYVTADGDIDQAAIQADLTDLLATKPGLAKPTGARLPGPNPAQAAGGFGGAPSPDDQIAAAMKAGDTRTVIALETQKLLTARKR